MSKARKLVRLAEIRTKRQQWIWEGYIPRGAITDLSGDPGRAKSRITYDLIRRITLGQPMPFATVGDRPQGVVLLQGEDSVSGTVKPTLQAARADLERVFVYDSSHFRKDALRLPGDLGLVRDAAKEVNASLVVVDPAVTFFECNANSEKSVRDALRPVAEFAEEQKLGVLLVRHLNKAASVNPLYQAAGSIAWVAAARAALRVVSDPSVTQPFRSLLSVVKSNLISAPPLSYQTVVAGDQIAVEWLGPATFAATLVGNIPQLEGTKMWEAAEILFLILRESGKSAREVIDKAREEGVALRTLERAKAALEVRSEKVQISKWTWHWTWSLPTQEGPLAKFFREKHERLPLPAVETM